MPALLHVDRPPVVLHLRRSAVRKRKPVSSMPPAFVGVSRGPCGELPRDGVAPPLEVAARARDPVVLGHGHVVAVGRVEELLPEAQARRASDRRRGSRTAAPSAAIDDARRSAASRPGTPRRPRCCAPARRARRRPDDALGQVTGQRPHERRLDALGRVDDEHVLAVGVDDEREAPVVRERDRARAGHDVAEAPRRRPGSRCDREAGELRRPRRRGSRARERRSPGSRASAAACRSRASGARPRARSCPGGRRRRRCRAPGRAARSGRRRSRRGPSATVQVAVERERLGREDADARAEEVRREERLPVGAPREAHGLRGHDAVATIGEVARRRPRRSASSCEQATKTCASSRLTRTPIGSEQTATLALDRARRPRRSRRGGPSAAR